MSLEGHYPRGNSNVDWRLPHPRLTLKKQIFKLVGSNYRLLDDADQMVFFSHMKGFKLKEDIRVYTDEQRQNEVLLIQARKVLDFSGAYDVMDSKTGERVGVFKRKGWKSILRDEWIVCDANEVQIGTLIEDSMVMALLRRFLSNLIPQNYDLMMGEQRVLDLRQNFNPFTYRLTVDFTLDPNFLLDRRMGIAAAILLAGIEGRQQN